MGWGGSVHCARYTGALPIGFWLAFWCAFLGIANRTRTVFAFCFVLESCKHQVGRIERLYLCLNWPWIWLTMHTSCIALVYHVLSCPVSATLLLLDLQYMNTSLLSPLPLIWLYYVLVYDVLLTVCIATRCAMTTFSLVPGLEVFLPYALRTMP